MIVISEFMDGDAISELSSEFDTHYDPNLFKKRADLLRVSRRASALIVRNQTRVDSQLLKSAENLRCVGRLGTGLDNIDVGACRELNAEIFAAAGINARSVAEYVIASAFGLIRGLFGFSERLLAGEWPRAEATGGELAGKRLGLVGFGATARATAEIARSLGMETAAFDPYLPSEHEHWQAGTARMEFDSLLGWCDIISIHVPLSQATRRLIDAESISAMRRGAMLVNASRGGVVDDLAVADALRSGQLGGAALDVFEHEPLSGEVASAFQGCPNLILTPHIAGVTHQANRRVSFAIAEAVAKHLRSNGTRD